MKYQKGTYQTDSKTGKHLTQRVMPQNNACRAQYTGNQNKQA